MGAITGGDLTVHVTPVSTPFDSVSEQPEVQALVAEEVRKLAEESQRAAASIGGLITAGARELPAHRSLGRPEQFFAICRNFMGLLPAWRGPIVVGGPL